MSWFDDSWNWAKGASQGPLGAAFNPIGWGWDKVSGGSLGTSAGMNRIGGPFGFGGSGTKGMPGVPDYKGAAEATAAANRPNVSTPFGGQSWTRGPNGSWNLNTTLAPGLQGTANSLQSQAQAANASPLASTDAARKQAEDYIYGRATSRLDPMYAQREQQMRTQLMNQGLDPSSEAFRTEMDTFNRGRNDAYQTAMNEAIQGGGAEASRSLADELRRRNAPLDELSKLQGFTEAPHYNAGPDYSGAAKDSFNAQLGQWNAGQAMNAQQNNALLQLFGLGAKGGFRFGGGYPDSTFTPTPFDDTELM